MARSAPNPPVSRTQPASPPPPVRMRRVYRCLPCAHTSLAFSPPRLLTPLPPHPLAPGAYICPFAPL
eukprot:scaffold3340_cov114-Isochrysis_galbana.AAC.2